MPGLEPVVSDELSRCYFVGEVLVDKSEENWIVSNGKLNDLRRMIEENKRLP